VVLLILGATNLPSGKYAVVIKNHPEVGEYLKALMSENSKLAAEELEYVLANPQKQVEWMSGDKAFLQTRIHDEVITVFDTSYLVTFDNGLVTCGQLRFGISEEPLLNFIAARRSSVGLVFGDVHLANEDFALLFDLVCLNKPYLE
jgi:hypothetical protein